MKIGFDAREILDIKAEHGGGVARFTLVLARCLAQRNQDDFVFYFRESYQSSSLFKKSNVKIVFLPKPRLPFYDEHVVFSRLLKKEKLDLFLSPFTSLPYFYLGKSIITVHDLAIFKHPEWFPEGQWFSKKVLVPRSLKKATKIIAVSNAVKKDLVRIFNLPENKITVLYQTLSPLEIFQKHQVVKTSPPNSPFLLFIGTLEPRKNLARIFKAFLELKKDRNFNDLKLCVLGKPGWKINEVYKEKSKEELEKNSVIFHENVNELEKQEFLKKTKLLVFPSLEEGFGLPIIEAQKTGIPILTSNVSAMPEIAGEGAHLVNPENVSEIREGVKKILLDEQYGNILIRNGKLNSNRFDLYFFQNNLKKILEK